MMIGALGQEGVAALRAARFELPSVPARVLRLQPALRASDGSLQAVPTLGYRLRGGLSLFSCEPIPPRFEFI